VTKPLGIFMARGVQPGKDVHGSGLAAGGTTALPRQWGGGNSRHALHLKEVACKT
jgi:hypothetical protein